MEKDYISNTLYFYDKKMIIEDDGNNIVYLAVLTLKTIKIKRYLYNVWNIWVYKF